MKPDGPRYERETIIRFDEESPFAEIWTASGPIYNKLKRLGLDQIEEGERHGVFKCLKSQVSIRKKRILTPEQRQSLVERGHTIRQKTVITVSPEQRRGK